MRSASSGLILASSFIFATLVCAAAHAQKDVALSVFGAYTNSAKPGNANFDRMNPAAAAGGMLEFRHIYRSWLGWQASYSFRGANEVFDELVYSSGCGTGVCPPTIGRATFTASANAQEFTADWVFTGRIDRVRPFLILGGGLLLTQPDGSEPPASQTVQPVLDYGVGFDWRFARHFGLRLQYRGDLYQAPGILPPNNTNPHIGLMNTSKPTLGLFYRF